MYKITPELKQNLEALIGEGVFNFKAKEVMQVFSQLQNAEEIKVNKAKK